MKEVKEIKVNVPKGRFVSAEIKDGICCIRFEVTEETSLEVNGNKMTSLKMEEDELFVCVEASKLSLDDEFMKYHPKSDSEKILKDSLEEVIRNGIADFYHSRLDPSVDEKDNIYFGFGMKPAVGKSYSWWYENAKKFNPEKNSRLGTRSEYIASRGVLIKELIAEKWSVAEAWDAVCNDSKKLGHYSNSESAKHGFETTGSRQICGRYDLANAGKILADDTSVGGFWIAGGAYFDLSNLYPIGDLEHYECCFNNLDYSVGWIVHS